MIPEFPTRSEIRKLIDMQVDLPLHTAALEFMLLKDRVKHPPGRHDSAKRFWLACQFPCCTGIRRPSSKWPWSQMTHGRTAQHVSYAEGVPDKVADIRRLSRLMRKYPALRTLGLAAVLIARQAAVDALKACAAPRRERKSSKARPPPATTIGCALAAGPDIVRAREMAASREA